MKSSTSISIATAILVCSCAVVQATDLTFSLGIRETGSTAAIGDPGGTSGGIEWLDKDLYVVPLDGAWHQVTIDFATATVAPFAGATANGVIDGTAGTIEHIRILNSGGVTDPIQLWFDDLIYTEATGAPHDLGWEGLTVGDEFRFQEPAFSGSTAGNLTGTSSSAVTDSMAHTGVQSYQADFQFVDNDPARWIRYTTFTAGAPANLPGGDPTIGFNGDVSFWVKGQIVPEPTTVSLAMLAGLGLALVRRRS